MPAPAEHIWLPGSGAVSLEVVRVDRAVQEYDPNLRFGRNEDTGDWCIFLIKRGEAPLPVLGFGREIPHPRAALQRLERADSVRRGSEILDEMNRHNESLRKPFEDAAAEGAAITAEAFEWGYRAMGKGKRVIIPVSGLRTNAMGGYS